MVSLDLGLVPTSYWPLPLSCTLPLAVGGPHTTDLATLGPIDQPRFLDDYFYSALVKDLNCLFLFFFLGVQQGPQVETSGKILPLDFCPESWCPKFHLLHHC